MRRVSRGTEISKYPEEKKSNEIPLVSDERTGNSPNPRFIEGVVGPQYSNEVDRKMLWNKQPKKVKVLYSKSTFTDRVFLSRLGDGKLPSEAGVTTLQG